MNEPWADRILEGRQHLESAERELRESVRDARKEGKSWHEIGAVLGTSRQAAWERFTRVPRQHPPEDLAS